MLGVPWSSPVQMGPSETGQSTKLLWATMVTVVVASLLGLLGTGVLLLLSSAGSSTPVTLAGLLWSLLVHGVFCLVTTAPLWTWIEDPDVKLANPATLPQPSVWHQIRSFIGWSQSTMPSSAAAAAMISRHQGLSLLCYALLSTVSGFIQFLIYNAHQAHYPITIYSQGPYKPPVLNHVPIVVVLFHFCAGLGFRLLLCAQKAEAKAKGTASFAIQQYPIFRLKRFLAGPYWQTVAEVLKFTALFCVFIYPLFAARLLSLTTIGARLLGVKLAQTIQSLPWMIHVRLLCHLVYRSSLTLLHFSLVRQLHLISTTTWNRQSLVVAPGSTAQQAWYDVLLKNAPRDEDENQFHAMYMLAKYSVRHRQLLFADVDSSPKTWDAVLSHCKVLIDTFSNDLEGKISPAASLSAEQKKRLKAQRASSPDVSPTRNENIMLSPPRATSPIHSGYVFPASLLPEQPAVTFQESKKETRQGVTRRLPSLLQSKEVSASLTPVTAQTVANVTFVSPSSPSWYSPIVKALLRYPFVQRIFDETLDRHQAIRFQNLHTVSLAIHGLTELCVASVHEDRYGLVFAALPVVLGTLARFKCALTLYSKASGSLTHKVVTQPRLVEAHDVVDSALYRITQAFYPEMGRISVPNKVHAKIIQSFLDYAV